MRAVIPLIFRFGPDARGDYETYREDVPIPMPHDREAIEAALQEAGHRLIEQYLEDVISRQTPEVQAIIRRNELVPPEMEVR